MDTETRKELQEKYGEDILEIGDEYMASIAEGGIVEPSVWNRIVSNIKSALRKIGINITQLLRFFSDLIVNQRFAFLICFTVFYKF